ncbi:MAG: hypothetical protein LBS69_07150 [Prevotellaceae bacterium]|jgi:hypothetical protein|nr:hypothetical protein [Prevotellaceae bacterium]
MYVDIEIFIQLDDAFQCAYLFFYGASDFRKMLDAEVTGEKYTPKQITKTPKAFDEWIEDNNSRIDSAEKRGTLPYWITENKDFINISDRSLSVGNFKTDGLNNYIANIKDINNISDAEVADILMSFAKDNPDLFNGELKSIEIIKNSNGYMSIERQYRLGAGDRISDSGNVLYISDKNINGFNPLNEFKGALNAIKQGQDLTFRQEYAVECVWHEFMHAKATGWGNINAKTTELRNSMEVVNQFCARRSYIPFLESLGGKSIHSADIIAKGFGYRNELDNFNLMIEKLNIDKPKLYDFLSDKIINTKYENLFDEITKYISNETGISKRAANELIDNLDIADYNYMKKLRRLKPAK